MKILGTLSFDRPWLMTVEPWRETRSHTQNARLWALHTLASQVTGYAPEEMHELMLCRFFGFEDVTFGGIKRQVPLKRSSTRDKKEFAEFMEATESFYISELGVWLGADNNPLSEEQI
jgi:hypothetical protein